MAKRIWVNKFRFYLRLGTIPIFIIGIVLLFYPKIFFSIVKHSDFNINIFNLFFLRFLGILFIYIFFTFEYMGSNPNYHRDLAFFQSLLLLGISIFFIFSIFLWNFSYYVLLISLYGIIYGIFLLMFASKNLLIRD